VTQTEPDSADGSARRTADVSPRERADLIARLRSAGCVFAEDEAELLIASAADLDQLDGMVSRRCTGVPIEQVVGWVDFCGVRVVLDPGVFVPRRRTELLAHAATWFARPGSTVVDLCCGSGAIGLVVATSVSGVRLVASDIDPAAVRCAQRNLAPLGALVVTGDLFDALPRGLAGAVDVLVANVPYVPSAAVAYLPAEARDYEPRHALDGGDDGLDVAREIAAQAPTWLAADGRFLVETSLDQAAAATDVMARAGLQPQVLADDDIDVAVVIGRRRASS
jgi:release factor glutamine methyltransferase